MSKEIRMCVAAEIEVDDGVVTVSLHAMKEPEDKSVKALEALITDKNICFVMVGPIDGQLCFTAIGPLGTVLHHHHKDLDGDMGADQLDRDAFMEMARGWGQGKDMAIAVASAGLKAFELAIKNMNNLSSKKKSPNARRVLIEDNDTTAKDNDAKLQAAQPIVANELHKHSIH
jgi:hypothetical protein